MTVKLLTRHRLEFLSFIESCTGLSESTLVKLQQFRGQKYFNIALVLQDEQLTIFTCPANPCTCPLKVYEIKNITDKGVICNMTSE